MLMDKFEVEISVNIPPDPEEEKRRKLAVLCYKKAVFWSRVFIISFIIMLVFIFASMFWPAVISGAVFIVSGGRLAWYDNKSARYAGEDTGNFLG